MQLSQQYQNDVKGFKPCSYACKTEMFMLKVLNFTAIPESQKVSCTLKVFNAASFLQCCLVTLKGRDLYTILPTTFSFWLNVLMFL